MNKHRRRLRPFFLLFGSFILLLGVYLLVIRSDYFYLKQIIVHGDEHLITYSLASFQRQHMLFLNTKSIAWEFQKQPWVKDVHVKKQLPNSVIVTLTKRTPVVYVQSNPPLYVDEIGKVIPQLDSDYTNRLPQIVCDEMPVSGDLWKINGSTKIFEIVHEALEVNIPIDSVHCASDHVFKMEVEGVVFTLSDVDETEQTVGSLLFLIKQFRIEGKRPKTVDLRFEKPVLRMDEGSTASPATDSGI